MLLYSATAIKHENVGNCLVNEDAQNGSYVCNSDSESQMTARVPPILFFLCHMTFQPDVDHQEVTEDFVVSKCEIKDHSRLKGGSQEG